MYLRHGFIADHITPGHGSKKNAIGIFDMIVAPTFPATHRTLSILARIEGSSLEEGPHRFVLELIDADGVAYGKSQELGFSLKKGAPNHPDAPLAWEIVIEIPQITLPRPGPFEFTVKVDGRHLGSIPLYALQVQDARLKH